MNTKKWDKWKLILLVPFVIVAHQAFAQSESKIKTDETIPIDYKENKNEEWLSKWTTENIGKGIFQPELESRNTTQKPNNVLVILMNHYGEFLIENQQKDKNEVKQIVKNYLNGINPDGKKGPDFVVKEIPFAGKVKVSQGIITYKQDLESSNDQINYTLRSIGEACLEVRNETAQVLFGNDYLDLDEAKQSATNEAMPVWFFYEFPKSPTPNVWLPFDRKPSKPDPFKIAFKSNGNVLVENYKFETLIEFEENLKYWNEDLDKFNKGRRSKGYYRAYVTYEDINRTDQKDLEYLLYKNNVQTSGVKSNVGAKTISILLKPDKDSPELEDIRKGAEKDFEIYNTNLKVVIQYLDGVTKEQVKSVMDVFLTLGIKNLEVSEYEYKKPSLPTFLLRLYPDEIQNALGDVLSLDAVSEYAVSWLKSVGTNYNASIYVYQNVSEERIQLLKQEMQKGGIDKEIIVKKI